MNKLGSNGLSFESLEEEKTELENLKAEVLALKPEETSKFDKEIEEAIKEKERLNTLNVAKIKEYTLFYKKRLEQKLTEELNQKNKENMQLELDEEGKLTLGVNFQRYIEESYILAKIIELEMKQVAESIFYVSDVKTDEDDSKFSLLKFLDTFFHVNFDSSINEISAILDWNFVSDLDKLRKVSMFWINYRSFTTDNKSRKKVKIYFVI